MVSGFAVLGYVENGWSLGDALYMVVLTVFTVGYDEVWPIYTVALTADTIGLITLGCTGMLFSPAPLCSFITVMEIRQIFGVRRMNKQIDQLKNHVIICGYGRLGKMLAEELDAGKAAFVVLERDATRFAEARDRGFLCLQADASEESALQEAGIDRARSLATVVPADAVNVFITLSARSLNKSLQIIARGESPSTERKLLQAGADAVVLPAHIGAEQVASLILFPSTAGVIQFSERRRQMEQDLCTLGLQLELAIAAEGSEFIGRSVEEIEREAERAFFIVAIETSSSGKAEHPLPTTAIRPGDGVTILGRSARSNVLDKFARPVR
jgi:trk system potassium uptake protein TrkA/voltage-gated potassium channel